MDRRRDGGSGDREGAGEDQTPQGYPLEQVALTPPVLYLLCGLSFAGKSTLARALAEPLGAQIVEADRFIPVVEAQFPDATKIESWRAIQALARSAVRDALTAGTSVLYDDLMVAPHHRDEMAQFAAAEGAVTVPIFLDTPVEAICERQRQASSKPEKLAQWEAHTQLLLSQLVPPARDAAVYVAPGDTTDAVLAAIRRHRQERIPR